MVWPDIGRLHFVHTAFTPVGPQLELKTKVRRNDCLLDWVCVSFTVFVAYAIILP